MFLTTHNNLHKFKLITKIAVIRSKQYSDEVIDKHAMFLCMCTAPSRDRMYLKNTIQRGPKINVVLLWS